MSKEDNLTPIQIRERRAFNRLYNYCSSVIAVASIIKFFQFLFLYPLSEIIQLFIDFISSTLTQLAFLPFTFILSIFSIDFWDIPFPDWWLELTRVSVLFSVILGKSWFEVQRYHHYRAEWNNDNFVDSDLDYVDRKFSLIRMYNVIVKTSIILGYSLLAIVLTLFYYLSIIILAIYSLIIFCVSKEARVPNKYEQTPPLLSTIYERMKRFSKTLTKGMNKSENIKYLIEDAYDREFINKSSAEIVRISLVIFFIALTNIFLLPIKPEL